MDNKKLSYDIILMVLPYWTPQIPPLGISCLKSYLNDRKFNVKIFDLNVDKTFRELYDEYFNLIRKYVDGFYDGGFYNIGHEVLQNHMMAHINYTNKIKYNKLVNLLLDSTFNVILDDAVIDNLDQILRKIYDHLNQVLNDILIKYQPSFFGLSVFKGNLPASLYSFRLCKEKHPEIKTIMGGAVFAQNLVPGSPDYETFLTNTEDYIDKIVIGEGEIILEKILSNEFQKDQRVYTCKDIQNEVLSFSDIIIPDYSELNLDFYPTFSSFTSRSCPFQCKFCTETVYWGKYRKKPIELIVEEFHKLYNRYGSQLFLMCDSLLNPVVSELSEVLSKESASFYWDGYLRIDKETTNYDKVFSWRKGGFYRARLGVESGSEKLLKSMNKKINLEDVKMTIKNMAISGIKTTTYWIVGYPGETQEDFNLTLDLITELSDYIYEAHANPFGYYYSGQAGTDSYLEEYQRKLMYPKWAKDMLLTQTWMLEVEPNRQVTIERLKEFEERCFKLGIMNPYTLNDIQSMDIRWKRLHKNAVPSLLEFKNRGKYIDENKSLKKISRTEMVEIDAIDLNFNF